MASRAIPAYGTTSFSAAHRESFYLTEHKIMPYKQPSDINSHIDCQHVFQSVRAEYQHGNQLQDAQCDGIPHEDIGFPFADNKV